MNSLLSFAEILKTLSKMEGLVAGLGEYYAQVEARTPIDDALIDQFLVKAEALSTAAAALKTVVYNPTPEEPTP